MKARSKVFTSKSPLLIKTAILSVIMVLFGYQAPVSLEKAGINSTEVVIIKPDKGKKI